MSWEDLVEKILLDSKIPYYDDCPDFGLSDNIPPAYILWNGWESDELYADNRPNMTKAFVTLHLYSAKRPNDIAKALKRAMRQAGFFYIAGGKLPGSAGLFPKRTHYYLEFYIVVNISEEDI